MTGSKENKFLDFIDRNAFRLLFVALAADMAALGLVFGGGQALLGMTAAAAMATGWGLIALAVVLLVVVAIVAFRRHAQGGFKADNHTAPAAVPAGQLETGSTGPNPADQMTGGLGADPTALKFDDEMRDAGADDFASDALVGKVGQDDAAAAPTVGSPAQEKVTVRVNKAAMKRMGERAQTGNTNWVVGGKGE